MVVKRKKKQKELLDVSLRDVYDAIKKGDNKAAIIVDDKTK